MKFLLLLALFGIIWWAWRKPAAPPAAPRAERPAEKMVACAHCGLLVPESESLGAGERRYCCEAHRRGEES
ncbi:MAG: hypothetical protein FWF20_02165 [Betaproteobacteria bacterium]|nr:hypothetical protein [Betaproteobacteria bacterium]MCL2885588.1 hypothetical protein [Betaproteobacteria bacterium]